MVASYDYFQDNGTLETTDATTCTLKDGSDGTGTAIITGGTVWIDNPGAGTYGVFNVVAANLEFSGSLNVSVAGNTGSPGTSDLLNVSGTTKLLQGSDLYVNVKGQPVAGNTWTIIQDGPGNNIQGNFFDIGSNPAGSVSSAGIDGKNPTAVYVRFGP